MAGLMVVLDVESLFFPEGRDKCEFTRVEIFIPENGSLPKGGGLLRWGGLIAALRYRGG